MCAKFIGSRATHSLPGPTRKRSLHGKQRLAITNSPRWTITVARVCITSLCDEEQGALTQQKLFSRRRTFESEPEADCISMKIEKDHYDAGFQVCYPAASEDAGIHHGRSIDACVGNRR